MSHEHHAPAAHCSCTTDHRRRGWRSRWAAIGAALAVVAGVGGISWAGATNAQVTPSQTYITPCRIMDTRSPGTVGSRSTPLGTNETHTIQVTGKNGNCTIPSDAAGVVMNVTLVSPGQGGFITVFPAGATRPNSSNLNYVAGQAPTPNQVTVGLSADGKVSFYASAGPVNLIADIVGYTTAARLTNTQLAQNRWDQDLGRPATVAVGTRPAGVAYDGTNVWVTNSNGNSVSKIDPATNTVTATVAVGSSPESIAFDGTSIWVANVVGNSLSKINPATNTVVATVNGFNGPLGLAFDGSKLWVAEGISSDVIPVNTATNTKFPVAIAVGAQPQGLAFDGTSLWVANAGSTFVTKVNPVTSITTSINVGINPVAVTFDGNNIWAANNGSDTVSKIKVTNSTVTAVAVGNAPTGMAYDGTNLWVSNNLDNTVTKIDPVTSSVVATVAVGTRPIAMAFDGSSVWVANSSSNSVSKLQVG